MTPNEVGDTRIAELTAFLGDDIDREQEARDTLEREHARGDHAEPVAGCPVCVPSPGSGGRVPSGSDLVQRRLAHARGDGPPVADDSPPKPDDPLLREGLIGGDARG